MPSLKDLRNRIASVKATQKITKAMQMVAAAKLRRAQEAAEAARPYAERMARCSPISPPRMAGRAGAPPLLAGTGKEQCICSSSAPPSAACAAASTRRSRGWPASMPTGCWPRARRSRSSASASKGNDILRRDYGRADHRRVDLRDVRQLGFANADADRRRRCSRCSTQASSTSARCSIAEFKSVITQIPTALQIIPAKVAGSRSRAERRRRRLRIRAGRGGDPGRSPAAQHRGADLPGAARKRRLRAWARR